MADTPSKTESAMVALYDMLDRLAAELSFPAPTRNEAAFVVLQRFTPERGDGGCFNLVDGNSDEPTEELLGEDNDASEAFEIEYRATVELMTLIADSLRRDATFDFYLQRFHNALRADRTLGGKVDWARIAGIDRSLIYQDGLPTIKGASITVAMTFTSDRPF